MFTIITSIVLLGPHQLSAWFGLSIQNPCHHDGASTISFPPREVRFLHPGYPPNQQVLFILPAADENGTLHHETARSACVLVAGREDGFLSEDQEGQRRLPEDTEARLNRNEYYFQVPGEEGTQSQHIRSHTNIL